MKPCRFPAANQIFMFPGGTEDNDLWVERTTDTDGTPMLRSVWVPTDEERARLSAGHNICLTTWGRGMPPVCIEVTPEQPGEPEGEQE